MEKNTNFTYKKLSPFKWFVLENFPFIEADFDGLTEWQLFCKLGKEINKIIESQNLVGKQAEDLTKAFNDLYNYVDNYFKNLDLQEEVNIKLNIMATDGTLDKIINQNIFSDINNKIDSLELSFNDFKNFYGYNYIVDINGNGDFTSISECVNNANNNEKIFIKNGTYNNEIIACDSKKLTLVGESKNNVIIKNTTGSYASAPISASQGVFKNMTVIAGSPDICTNNGGYAVHIDNDHLQNNEIIFENCNLYSYNNAGVGIGMRPFCKIIFKDCDIISFAKYNLTTNKNCSGLFVHTSNENEGDGQNLYLLNCIITGSHCPAMVMQSCKSPSNRGYIIAQGTSFKSLAFNFTENLITQNLFSNATAYNITFKEENFANTPLVMPSTYKTSNFPVIGKFLQDDLQYLVKRAIKAFSLEPNVDTTFDLSTWLDDKFQDLISLDGWIKHSSGTIFPLNYNYENNFFIGYISPDKKLHLKSNIKCTGQLCIEYYINNY